MGHFRKVLERATQLRNYGVEVFFVSDNIRTLDGDGELRLSIMATMAQEESRKISERVRAGQATSRANHVLYGNGNIIGYDRVGSTYIINEEQAKTIRTIYTLYSQGLGEKAIVNELGFLGCKDGRGKVCWSCAKVSRILRNKTYMGMIGYRKSTVNNYLEKKRINNLDEESIEYVKGDFVPIIDEELWNKCEAIDAMSGASLKIMQHTGNWRGVHYLALGGTDYAALDAFLTYYPNITHIVLCLDNDEAGRTRTQDIIKHLEGNGKTVEDRPPPIGKDYNDTLVQVTQEYQKYRIYNHFQQKKTEKETVAFLKKEYADESSYHIHAEQESQDEVLKSGFSLNKLVSTTGQPSPALKLEGAGFTVYRISKLSKAAQFTTNPDGSYNGQSILDVYRKDNYDNLTLKYDFTAEGQAVANMYESNTATVEAYNATLTADGDYANGKGNGWVSTDQDAEYRLAELYTNEEGVIRIEGLPYGQYLVVETTIPKDVFQCDPFIVTVSKDSPQSRFTVPVGSVTTATNNYMTYNVLDEER